MTSKNPFWLYAAPVIFLLLWSGGFSVAKLGISHAEPLSFLCVRYACVCALLAPLVAILRPPMPQKPMEWAHIAIVGLLIQTGYFGLSYLGFKAGVSAGGLAIIVCLQPILVGLIAPRFTGAGSLTLQPASAAALRQALWRYPAMTAMVMARIHWQALQIWLKRVGFHRKPPAPDRFVTR